MSRSLSNPYEETENAYNFKSPRWKSLVTEAYDSRDMLEAFCKETSELPSKWFPPYCEMRMIKIHISICIAIFWKLASLVYEIKSKNLLNSFRHFNPL